MVEDRHLQLSVLNAIVILTLAVLFSQESRGSENILCLYKCYLRI